MTRDEAVTRIQRTLGFTTANTTEIRDALQDSQVELERSAELPWFLLSEVASISTVKDEERILLPTDFLREWEDDALWYFNGTADLDADKWVPLTKDDIQFLRGHRPSTGPPPEAYAIDGLYFRIFPTPDAVYTLKQI